LDNEGAGLRLGRPGHPRRNVLLALAAPRRRPGRRHLPGHSEVTSPRACRTPPASTVLVDQQLQRRTRPRTVATPILSTQSFLHDWWTTRPRSCRSGSEASTGLPWAGVSWFGVCAASEGPRPPKRVGAAWHPGLAATAAAALGYHSSGAHNSGFAQAPVGPDLSGRSDPACPLTGSTGPELPSPGVSCARSTPR